MLHNTFTACAVSALFLSAAAAALTAPAPVTHVVLISVDGLSATCLRDLLATNSAAYPTFTRLLSEGAVTLNARCDYTHSETIPNHTTMLLGRPVLQPAGFPNTAHHGYIWNSPINGHTFHKDGNPNVDYFASVFDVVHDHGLTTAFFAGKSKLAICYHSYNETNGAPDLVGDDNGRNKVDYAEIVDWNGAPSVMIDGEELMAAVTNYLADHAPNYLFLHLADLDYIGHYTGWGSERWLTELIRMDGWLADLLAALDANPAMAGHTSLILTTDHGGGDPSNTHVYPERPLNYTIPFIVWGPGWPGDVDAYDLFANRFDPRTNRVTYSDPHQPLRNGDASNLALTLLGLPPIPGSVILPQLGRKLTLTWHTGPAGLTLSWPSDSDGFILETTSALPNPQPWLPVTGNIHDDGISKSYPVPPNPAAPQFFRLRQPTPPNR